MNCNDCGSACLSKLMYKGRKYWHCSANCPNAFNGWIPFYCNKCNVQLDIEKEIEYNLNDLDFKSIQEQTRKQILDDMETNRYTCNKCLTLKN